MSVVKVTLFHPGTKATVMEKRLILSQPISQIKYICSTHFQTCVEDMSLKLIDGAGKKIDLPIEDERPLGYYQVQDGWTVEVMDLRGEKASYIGIPGTTNSSGEEEKVEKFEISESDYLKRPDNARLFKEQMLAKRRAEAEAAGETLPEQLTENSFAEEAAAIKVSNRCQVFPGDRLAEVKFVGRLAGLKPGYWIGVEFDEPVGKNDGTLKGNTVFECRGKNYGGFVRPKDVTVGDFPAEEF